MKMTELAAEYRQSGAMLKTRIDELTYALQNEKMRETDRKRLRDRIVQLTRMYRYVNEAAVAMERYYDKGYRNGSFSL